LAIYQEKRVLKFTFSKSAKYKLKFKVAVRFRNM